MSILFLQSSRCGREELAALLCLPSWYIVIVVWLFLTMPWGCLQSVIVVFPDHTLLLFLKTIWQKKLPGDYLHMIKNPNEVGPFQNDHKGA